MLEFMTKSKYNGVGARGNEYTVRQKGNIICHSTPVSFIFIEAVGMIKW